MKKLFIPFLCIYISGYLSSLAASTQSPSSAALSCQKLGIKLMGETQVIEMDPQTRKTKTVSHTQEITSISKDNEIFEKTYLSHVTLSLKSISLNEEKKESNVKFTQNKQRADLTHFNTAEHLSTGPQKQLLFTLHFKNNQKCQLGVTLNEMD